MDDESQQIIKQLGAITLLNVQPGDTLAIKIPKEWQQENIENSHSIIRRHVPLGVRFFFYRDDLEFKIITNHKERI